MVPKLILVEGLPGCGKSTTAQFLARQLRRAGHRARWHYEEETPHPVFKRPAESATWDGYFADRLGRWTDFVAAVRSSDQLWVLESAILQIPIMTTLRGGAGTAEILAFLGRIQSALVPLSPLVIHLRHPRPDEALRAILARRGGQWEAISLRSFEASEYAAARGVSGVDGWLGYWREHAALIDAALARSSLAIMIVTVGEGEDWAARRSAILGRLGLSPVEDRLPSEPSLRRFVGTYRGGVTASRQCAVTLRDGRLVLDGLLWPGNPLLPRTPAGFEIESWPFELDFEEDGGGDVRAMRVTGPPLGWGRIDGVYERVAAWQ